LVYWYPKQYQETMFCWLLCSISYLNLYHVLLTRTMIFQ
jgi:hypothetical protein